jgi:hypothetical protein
MKTILKTIVSIFAIIGGLVSTAAIVFMSDYYLGEEDRPNVNCSWSDTVSVWLDENENGLWDNDEQPLAGVRFIVDDVNFDDVLPHEAVSDKNGKAELFISPLNCNVNRTKILLYAITPDGYKPTTPWRIIIPIDIVAGIASSDFRFGFVKR